MNIEKMRTELTDLYTKIEGIRNMMKYQGLYILGHDKLLGIMQKIESILKDLQKNENNTNT
jgi:hypothetical protein